MQRAHFRPARDEDGQPVYGIVDRNFYSRFDQHSHGPTWHDYILTVNSLPYRSKRESVLCVVTDNEGHIDSCMVEETSGSEGLDRATCNYTRERIVLAPPLGREGKPVRTLRLVNVGFVKANGISK